MSDLRTPARVVASLLKPYRGRVIFAAIALVVAAAAMLGVGQGLRAVIDRGFTAGDTAWLDRTLMAMFGVIALLAAATWLRFYNVSWLGERVTADLRRRVFDHLLSLPPSYFEREARRETHWRHWIPAFAPQVYFLRTASLALRDAGMKATIASRRAAGTDFPRGSVPRR